MQFATVAIELYPVNKVCLKAVEGRPVMSAATGIAA